MKGTVLILIGVLISSCYFVAANNIGNQNYPTAYNSGGPSGAYDYLIFTFENATDTYYAAKDSFGRVVDAWTSTNKKDVMQSCADALLINGGTIVSHNLKWDQSIPLPNDVGVIQNYAGNIEYYGAARPVQPRLSTVDFFPRAVLPDGTLMYRRGYPSMGFASDEDNSTSKYFPAVHFESSPRFSFVTAEGTLLIDGYNPNLNWRGLYRVPNASFDSIDADFTRVMNNTSGTIWSIDQDTKGNIYAGWYSSEGVAGVGAVIFKSNDDGLTWNAVYNDTQGYHIHNLRVDPYTDYVYATIGGDSHGDPSIVRSVDEGDTWEEILAGSHQCLGIAFTPEARFFGTDGWTFGSEPDNPLIYKTTDDVTREVVLNCSSNGNAYNFWMAESRGYLFAGFVNAGSHIGGGVYYSADEGNTWEILITETVTGDHVGFDLITKGLNDTIYIQRNSGDDLKISFEHQPTKILVDGKNNVANGTWISHHFGMKLENIQLTIEGNAYVNSTCYYLNPTVLVNELEGFQISALMVKDGDVIPVSDADKIWVMWMARR